MSEKTNVYEYSRRKTRVMQVGSVAVGGDHPIRVQSMTNSPTHDVDATVEQIVRLSDAGCEIARVTVQGIREAKACEAIKGRLVQRGLDIPLVADIHFFPPAAMQVADFVDKIRVNPGNYADKRATFKEIEYTDASYAEELVRIEEKFTPLVEKCKLLGRAMRIGTNHGSLSDRIMNRYGDTPAGMVESALEFARICRKNDFHNFCFSMKASNPQVMIHAYRLLVAEMDLLGWDYPLHLGVTEAGDGEDGRVKSAMGIGTLLLDGLGDTIRVSLTEDPWHEIEPCRQLVAFAQSYRGQGVAPFEETLRNWREPERRRGKIQEGSALHRDGSVLLEMQEADLLREALPETDLILLRESITNEQAQSRLHDLQEQGVGVVSAQYLRNGIQLVTLQEEAQLQKADRFAIGGDSPLRAVWVGEEPVEEWAPLVSSSAAMILFGCEGDRLYAGRHFFQWLHENGVDTPVILAFDYPKGAEEVTIHASAECGALLCDGLGDGVAIRSPQGVAMRQRLSYTMLQAARMRTTKTEFISCPSCGRTLFDLQEVTQKIRKRTEHLAGVKIAIMGCIVNGPGEMADADFGYVGSRPGMIDLYVGKERVEKNIPFDEAEERLVDLIKAHDRWEEPQAGDLIGSQVDC